MHIAALGGGALMGIGEREKRRLVPLRKELFSTEACEPGMRKRKR